MHPGRADVIGAGALILAAVVDRVGLPEVIASEHDILDGIAWSLAESDRTESDRTGPVRRGAGGEYQGTRRSEPGQARDGMAG